MRGEVGKITILPEPEVVFEEAGHTYTWRGYKLPSVTGIMEPMSLMLYKNVPPDVLSAAADRGTRAHEQIANYINFGVLEADPDTMPYLEAFDQFSKMYNPEWLGSEYRVHHAGLMYAGTLDIIGYVLPDDGRGVDVVDIKTTAQFHHMMLGTQISAYSEALKSMGVPIRNIYGLQLTKDGAFKFEQVDNHFKVFLHCLAIHNAMMKESRP